MLHHAFEITAVVESSRGRIKTGMQPVAQQMPAVVRFVAVLEAVGQQEVDHLVAGRAAAQGIESRCFRSGRINGRQHRHRRGDKKLAFERAVRRHTGSSPVRAYQALVGYIGRHRAKSKTFAADGIGAASPKGKPRRSISIYTTRRTAGWCRTICNKTAAAHCR